MKLNVRLFFYNDKVNIKKAQFIFAIFQFKLVESEAMFFQAHFIFAITVFEYYR